MALALHTIEVVINSNLGIGGVLTTLVHPTMVDSKVNYSIRDLMGASPF